ncbi:MaoC/PaaZ C-terminal domain-containing protein [Janibacter limosus]|uniref:MaoC family dehydratase N-terminal domain-containing protein n=1 Tax=Janibacter limosus TaxID=53458 RepID=A0AC61U5V3_9MICO|nr:MaoC/PaaZ C-terminal domain-containing protein [Janibacter limosus]UUZ45390.1 MaoC/PaaZ C-terminal domain-containing protein [Janibacter limosus]
MSEQTVRQFSQVSEGETLPERSIPVTRAHLVHYAGASGDRNVIHWDERTAQAVGLPDVIAHGMLTMGAAVRVVTDWVGDAGRVIDYGTRFTGPVVVPHDGGAVLDVAGKVTSTDPESKQATVELTVTCGGDKVLGRCRAVVQLD